MIDKPLVSIVIPAYNASNYLAEAIDSVLAQTYTNYEIIVVNDGSPDDGATRAVALSYGDKIRYYEKENGGCASALNFGISKMRGVWFSWLSHDDLYLPEKLEKLIDLIDRYGLNPDKVVLGCNDYIMGPDNIRKPSLFNNSIGVLSPVKAFGETLNKKTFNGCGLMIPRALLANAGEFRTDYKHLLDREMWMRIAVMGYSYCYTDEPLIISRVHGQQVTVKAQSLLYAEESKLIDEYNNLLKDKKMFDFQMQLCFFAFKRKHYKVGRKIAHYLKESKQMNTKIFVGILRYKLEGKMKRTVGMLYKRMIRRG